MNASIAPVVEATGLGVRFGRFAALSDVSVTRAGGTGTGRVGPNGAGKTTLVRILATLLVPTSGRAVVSGHDVVSRPAMVRRAIGYLPDFAGIYMDMRVTEYLRFFADAHGLDRSARARFVEKALSLSGLAGRGESFVEELSRGMRSRLSFVRALAGDPRLLLLDEPLSNLDPVARGDMLEILGRLRAGGTTILVSSHILTDLEKICDGVLFLDRGRIVTEALPGTGNAAGATYCLGLAEPAPDDMLSFAGSIPGVVSVTPVQGAKVFTVTLRDAGIAPAALRALVGKGLDIVRWHEVTSTLEDRLVRAVRGGGDR